MVQSELCNEAISHILSGAESRIHPPKRKPGNKKALECVKKHIAFDSEKASTVSHRLAMGCVMK